MLSIRQATSRDLTMLHQWASASFWETLRPDQRAQIDSNMAFRHADTLLGTLQEAGPLASVIIADVRGQPVGYAASSFNPDSSTGEMQGYIVDLYVIPQWRHRGIGRALQRVVEKRFASAGIRKIKVIGELHNPIAVEMAFRSGYRPEGLVGVKEGLLPGAR